MADISPRHLLRYLLRPAILQATAIGCVTAALTLRRRLASSDVARCSEPHSPPPNRLNQLVAAPGFSIKATTASRHHLQFVRHRRRYCRCAGPMRRNSLCTANLAASRLLSCSSSSPSSVSYTTSRAQFDRITEADSSEVAPRLKQPGSPRVGGPAASCLPTESASP